MQRVLTLVRGLPRWMGASFVLVGLALLVPLWHVTSPAPPADLAGARPAAVSAALTGEDPGLTGEEPSSTEPSTTTTTTLPPTTNAGVADTGQARALPATGTDHVSFELLAALLLIGFGMVILVEARKHAAMAQGHQRWRHLIR